MTELMSREDKIVILTARWGGDCFSCRKLFVSEEDITFDHWIPQSWARANGWTEDRIHNPDNLRLMHKPCNAKKGDLIPVDETTVPVRETSETQRDRKMNKGPRPEGCFLCETGRLLLPGETCPDCGIGPQPACAPKTLQKSPKECDHDTFHCWMCFIGHIERKSALDTLITGS